MGGLVGYTFSGERTRGGWRAGDLWPVWTQSGPDTEQRRTVAWHNTINIATVVMIVTVQHYLVIFFNDNFWILHILY